MHSIQQAEALIAELQDLSVHYISVIKDKEEEIAELQRQIQDMQNKIYDV